MTEVHFNHAGAGIPSAAVDRAVRDYLDLERELGPYEAEASAGETAVEDARAAVARLLGCAPSAVALFDNATRAWGTLVGALPLRTGDTVWVSRYDYVGNVFLLKTIGKRLGVTVEPIPLTEAGDLDLDWVERSLTDEVALVSVSHVPSCCGVVSDVVGLGERLRGSRAYYVVDGCQAVGNVEIDVPAIGADVYTGAGRKFLAGPRGTGFAALSRRYLSSAVPLVQDVHAFTVSPDGETESWVREARDLELAERSIATLAGLRVAVDEHMAGRAESGPRRQRLLARLEEGVTALPGVRRLGEAAHRSGICSLILDQPCGPVYERLLARGVHAWVGTGWHTPLFAPDAGAAEFLRLSVGAGTTEAEVDFVVAELAAALG